MGSVEELSFVGGNGNSLSGLLHKPEGQAKGSILLAHCFSCTKDVVTMSRMSKGLADAGYAALKFDFTGLGSSGGDFAKITVSGNGWISTLRAEDSRCIFWSIRLPAHLLR